SRTKTKSRRPMESASASIAPSWTSSSDRVSQEDLPQHRRVADRPRYLIGRVQSSPTILRSLCFGKVESRCGAVAVGQTYLLPPLSFGGASLVRPWLCFHIPLIEPDMQISRIRLSDKTSRLRPRLAAPSRGQTYETVMPVEVREWISPAPASPDLVLVAQPLAHPHGGVIVERPIRFRD